MKYVNVLGFRLFSDSLSKIKIEGNPCKVINTISPNSYGITTYDKEFKESLVNCDYLLLDGVYFALASILLEGRNIKRNQGPDIFYHFMSRLEELNGRAFFLGSSNETLEKIKTRASKEYPNINIAYFSPPYKVKFDSPDNDEMLIRINNFNPDVLFVGMTCPKQEKWAYEHRNDFKSKLAISVGGVFDWYAGNLPEISPIWWKLRLGWVKRIIDRPEVLKRNLPNVLIFLKDVFLFLVRIKNYKICRIK